MANSFHSVTILGAGLLGSLLAWRLARENPDLNIKVLEKSERRQLASAANSAAAMVAPVAERDLIRGEQFQAGLNSVQLWPQLLQQLHHDSGEKVAFSQRGSLVVAHHKDLAELREFHQQRVHLGCESYLQTLDGEGLHALEPGLSKVFQQGYFLADEMHIDNRHLLPVLHRAAANSGAQLYFNWPVTDDYLNQMDAEELIFDCRGVGAKSLLNNVAQTNADQSSDARLRGVRGEVCWIESAEVKLTRPIRLLHPRYHLYLVPKGQNDQGHWRYILGATEIESEDDSPVSVRSALEMLSALYCLNPALAEARIIELDANLRPAFAHHQPQFFLLSDQAIALNGLFRHGYLLAPDFLRGFDQYLKDFSSLRLGLTELLTGKALTAEAFTGEDVDE